MAEEKLTQEKLDEMKQNAWDNFKNWMNGAEYHKLDIAEIKQEIRGFLNDMSEELPKEQISVPVTMDSMAEHPNWKSWKTLVGKIEGLGGKIPANPDKAIWTDRRNGIIPGLKGQVKEFGEEFTDERFLKHAVVREANQYLNKHQNFEGQINVSKSIKEAQEMIQKSLIDPQLESLTALENKIKGM